MLRGFYAGNLVNCVRVAPYAGSVCLGYSLCLRVLPEAMPDPSRRFLAGGAAGTAATLITYPFDIVRARMTVDPNSKHMLETARTIVREGGGFRSHIMDFSQHSLP